MDEPHITPAAAAGEFPLAPSWRLAAILVLGHGGVAAIVLWLEISFAWRIALIALLIVSLIHELRTTALRLGANAVNTLRIAADNTFSVQTRRGDWRTCEVLGSTYVTAFLTVLNLRLAGQRRMRSVVLMSDSMAADDFRRLRVWLRWRPPVKPD